MFQKHLKKALKYKTIAGNHGNVIKETSLQSEQSPPLNKGGNVGIGTDSPNAKLEINVTSNGTINAPVINTTGNNLTISLASGSVIIRLG